MMNTETRDGATTLTENTAENRGWGPADWLIVGSAAGALGLSLFLVYQSVVVGDLPPGCGAGSGCGEVLTSKYAKLFGVPVSVLAAATYLGLIACWLLARNPARANHSVYWSALVALSVAVVGSVGWFVCLQVFVIRAICVYCMTDHALGLVAALAVLHVWWHGGRPVALPKAAGLAFVALLGVGAMAIGQHLAKAPVHQLDSGNAAHDKLTGGQLVLFEGKLTLNLADEPRVGPADAERVVVMLFDYACPHCRHSHELLRGMVADADTPTALVLLPMSINPKCNPAFEEAPDRFAQSCELAEIALSVFYSDPAKYDAFDRWLFETAAPRKAAAAKAHAEQRVGAEALAANLTRAKQVLTRNVNAYIHSGADRVPVMIVPGQGPVVGRIEDATAIEALFTEPGEK